jgi:hypothetical protein
MAIHHHDTKLIRLAAGRYHELQGLATIADTGLLLTYASFLSWGYEEWHADVMGAIVVGWLIARATLIRWRITAYYARRCGRVAAKAVMLDPSFMFLMGLLYGSWSRTWHVPMPVRVALIMVPLAAEPAWIAARDWPHRAHWILPIMVGVLGAASLAVVSTDEQSFAWQGLFGLLGGLSIAAAGWLDHALLLKVLGNGPALELEQTEPLPPAR